ncbi:flagellar assembly protein FliW [Paenibacillus sp. UNC496MF]|uniref:flagellar assembly protein FliW n=1 Tax=Paenibacillus sp. UNC496MF TaxID=1502753 RepID=UPI0015A57EC2|nr:flagellar assembly protein FliW [Paenibacillus sp. UNC496MF]
MIIHTTRFGALEIEENEIIDFPLGIPGFPEHRSYTLMPIEESPFYFLQSVEEGRLSFIVVSPFEFFPKYEFELQSNILHALGQPLTENLRVLNIVTVKGNIQEATANLAAPIIWNTANNSAAQVVLQDPSYLTKHTLFPSVTGQEKEGRSC